MAMPGWWFRGTHGQRSLRALRAAGLGSAAGSFGRAPVQCASRPARAPWLRPPTAARRAVAGAVALTSSPALTSPALPVPDLLNNRPIGQRAVVISAGVVANIIFAFAVLFAQVRPALEPPAPRRARLSMPRRCGGRRRSQPAARPPS